MAASRVTDEMLTKPAGELTEVELAILQAAFGGPFSDELFQRIDKLDNSSTSLDGGRSDQTSKEE